MTAGGVRRIWLRWSLRDLRQRWVLVVAIGAVLALGTGMFAALGSTATWRRASNDASFAAVDFHDLRVRLPAGSTVDRGRLAALVDGLAPDLVDAASERLRLPTQVEADTSEGPVLVRGELVGVDITEGQPAVDRVHVFDGEPLAEGRAVLEVKFADVFDLPTSGTIRLVGDVEVAYGGVGAGPEEFVVIGDEAGFLGERSWATVYAPLTLAGEVSGAPGQVNDLVVATAADADLDLVEAELEAAAASVLALEVTVEQQRDVVAFRTLYDDIENDQKVWNVMAGLILVGAVVACVNLVTRVVESQRREIGVGMALGVSPARLALRPLLLGAQVGVLGVVGGLGIGLLIGAGMQSLFKSFVPLPVWVFDFQWRDYAFALVLGLLLPVVAAAVPVWRAVRVEPVAAIGTAHVQLSRKGLLGPVGRRLRLPGRSLAQLPLRNLVRSPRRSVLTAVAVGAAITSLVAVLGMLDSLVRTVDASTEESLQGADDRLDVQLTGFPALDGPEVAEVASVDGVAAASVGLQVPAQAASIVDPTTDPVGLLLRFVDLGNDVWSPTLTARADGRLPTEGVLLSEKAAADLGVEPGDAVLVRHPQIVDGAVTLGDTELPVAGLHPDPIRAFAHADLSVADRLGLGGVANLVQLRPEVGTTATALQRTLFPLPQVATSQSARALSDVISETTDEFTGFLRVLQGGVLVLALLIAFNAASIAADERAREHATMFAFGVPVRSVTAVNVVESAVIGIFGTALGLLAGYGVVRWMVYVLLNDTFPELGMLLYLSRSTLVTVLVLGIAVVSFAPTLAVRRLTRMEISDTLRLVE